MEYKIRFPESQLRNDIADKFEPEMPGESIEERFPIALNLADEAIREIKHVGNSALYQGLVMYGKEIALKQTQTSSK
jgi:hypothetical protein